MSLFANAHEADAEENANAGVKTHSDENVNSSEKFNADDNVNEDDNINSSEKSNADENTNEDEKSNLWEWKTKLRDTEKAIDGARVSEMLALPVCGNEAEAYTDGGYLQVFASDSQFGGVEIEQPSTLLVPETRFPPEKFPENQQ
jgi:hypothetical protein